MVETGDSDQSGDSDNENSQYVSRVVKPVDLIH
jgi:hypothetical protein